MAGGEANLLLHMFHRGCTDLYTFYNMGIDPLPPPPRPQLTKAFHYACAILIAEMESGEDYNHSSGSGETRLKRKYKDFQPS